MNPLPWLSLWTIHLIMKYHVIGVHSSYYFCYPFLCHDIYVLGIFVHSLICSRHTQSYRFLLLSLHNANTVTPNSQLSSLFLAWFHLIFHHFHKNYCVVSWCLAILIASILGSTCSMMHSTFSCLYDCHIQEIVI